MNHYSIDEMLQMKFNETEEKLLFQQHLDKCSDCRIQFQELNSWSDAWDDDITVAPDFHEKVWQKVESTIMVSNSNVQILANKQDIKPLNDQLMKIELTKRNHNSQAIKSRRRISRTYIHLGLAIATALVLMSSGVFQEIKQANFYQTILKQGKAISKYGNGLMNQLNYQEIKQDFKKK